MSMENLDPLRQKPDHWSDVVDGKIDVPDYLMPLFNKIGTQLRFHTISGKGEVEAIAHMVAHAEEDRDKFAIGFGNWIADYVDEGFKTTANLLELYKESLLNQKP